MKTVCIVIGLLLLNVCDAQDLKKNITEAISRLQKDEQFRHAVVSMYVTDKAGNIIYQKDPETGMAPASTQKIITSATAFEMLGKKFRYKTEFFYSGRINETVKCIYIKGNGDPSSGSWRYALTKEDEYFSGLKKALDKMGIKKIVFSPRVTINKNFSTQVVPDGWIWQDIGNYYGAGAGDLNWRENQYDIILSSGMEEGSKTLIKKLIPSYTDLTFYNEVTAGPKGSGDNAYIYLGLNPENGYLRGTIPIQEDNFSISGSVTEPYNFFLSGLNNFLLKNKYIARDTGTNKAETEKMEMLYNFLSPTLDSLNYWFLKRSINLYGEAFVKTIANEKGKKGSTSEGINIIRDFWSVNGIEKPALHIIDGSGLSPANRVTTKALVQVLEFAKNKNWFASFYNALPEINNLKMKDGYISGVRAYAGYSKTMGGQEYTFAFIVNNFYGNAGNVREKMWKVLDLLK
ncbi:MAG: D-alanyl-D-alanine carboxypeptidase/D-alanyl-D-alanine-endopeptidase [Ferruginibacter sp.]